MLALRSFIKSQVLIKPPIPFTGVSKFSSQPHIRHSKLFEKIVKQKVQRKEITIDSISYFTIPPPTDSYFYDIRKIAVTYYLGKKDENIKPAYFTKHLMVKELPSEKQAAIYGSKQAAKNEVAFYNEILPVLRNNKTPRLPVPNAYYLHENLIVLDDPHNYAYRSIYNTQRPINVIQMAYVIMELARIHGASLIAERIDPHSFARVRNSTKEIWYNGEDQILFEHQHRYLDSLIKYFARLPSSSDNSELVDLLEDLKENSVQEITKLFQQPNDYSVMCHGALGSSNILMDENTNVMFTELCQMRYSSLASDISYLLYTNLDPVSRVQNEEKLLNMYLAALNQVTSNGGVDIKNEITASWLENEMRKWEMYGLLYGLWSTPLKFGQLLPGVKKSTIENLEKQNIDNYGPEFKNYVKCMLLNFLKPFHSL